MSTRKPRNQKSNKKKHKNAKNADEAKFFVLAPNILEKLGINLGTKTNENHSKEDLLGLYDTGGKDDKNREYNQSESYEINTSLSETAALMKNSVLLSPTFSQNTIEGTSKDFVDISNIEVIDTNLNETYNKSEVEMVTMKPDPVNNLKDVHSKATIGELINPLDIFTINGENDNQTNEINHQNIEQQSNLLTEHPDNYNEFVFKVPYSQTNSLTGSEVALNTVEQNKNKGHTKNDAVSHTPSNNSKPKLGLSTVDKEITKPFESNLKPQNNNSETFDHQELHKNNKCNDSTDKKGMEKNCEKSVEKSIETTNEEKYPLTTSSEVKSKPTEKADEKSEKNTEVQNSSINNNVSTNCIATNKDKVKVIADYLNKYAKKATMHTKQTKVMSKSTIQGVEKPGGEFEVNKSGGQTYERINKQAPKKHVSLKNTVVKPYPESQHIDYEGMPTIVNDQAYCNCYDFGSFTNYDENIHFSDTTSLPIQNEVIYEIYSDEDKSLQMDSDSFIDISEIDQSDILRPICWNIFGSKENNLNDIKSEKMANLIDNNIMNIETSCIEVKEKSPIDIEKINKPTNTCNIRNTDVGNKSPNSNVITPTTQQKELSRKGKAKNNNKKDLNLENSCSANVNDKNQMCSESLSLEKHVTKTPITVDKCTKLSPVKIVPNVVTKSTEKKYYGRKQDDKDIKNNPTLKKGSSCNFEVNTETNFNKGGQKRKRSLDNVVCTKKSLKCGVCDATLSEKEWVIHSEEVHCFIAWHSGQDFNNIFDINLKEKLDKKLQTVCLKCTFCNLEFKESVEFIEHVKKCKILKDKQNEKETKLDSKWKEIRDSKMIDTSKSDKIDLAHDSAVESEDEQTLSKIKEHKDSCSKPTVKCGVCLTETSNWIDHISKEHKYIAWKYGEKPLECCDENDARRYLQNILKEISELVCYKCGLVRKQARAYLKHIKTCDENISFNFSIVSDISQVSDTSCLTKCGVCGTEVNPDDWMEHITKEHEYIAWKEGDDPLDINKEEQIRLHLHRISKQIGGLTCPKCGTVRKYAKHYLDHVKDCTGQIPMDISSTSISNDSKLNITETPPFYKCGVCSKQVDSKDWIEHIFKEHEYFAWKEGDTPLDINEEEQIRLHLYSISKQIGALTCPKCGIVRKYAKHYLDHVKDCTGQIPVDVSSTSISNDSKLNITETPPFYNCGVCSKQIDSKDWIEHIFKEHEYFAWKEGDTPLNTEDKDQIKEHLFNINKMAGGLKCSKCGIIRKYVKLYLTHIESCTGETKELVKEESDSDDDLPEEVRCGVCKMEMKREVWISHIEENHNYLAWWDIEDPLDLDNEEEVNEHLKNISYSNGGLKCTKCGYVKKYPKRYLDHIKIDCTKFKTSDICVKKEKIEECIIRRGKNELLECARCHMQIIEADWQDHAMKEHYNIAWAVGDTPIDIRNQNAVDKYLKAYLKRNKVYRCKVCKLTRVSSYGFYAHIIVCGKSDEETEIFKEHCEICNVKYLCVYRSQHMTAHKESELSKLRRIELQERNEKAIKVEQEPIQIVSGKRRAAQKAISVIGNISKDDKVGKGEDFSDSDESVNLDSADSEESESDVDSNISDQEHEDRATEKIRTHNDTIVEYAKTLPFDISDMRAFIQKSAKDFAEMYYTDGVLFPKWRPFPVDNLDIERISEYLPELEQSCSIHFDDDVVTMKRFEAIKGHLRASYLFIGGTIRQVCWVPSKSNDRCDSYLTVVCHNGGDLPRHNYDEIVAGPGSIQIWNCGLFDKLASLSLVLLHDYGVVWSMAWCPSGARDSVSTTLEEPNTFRLGLLAAACSNGHVYIFSVPYPAENDNTMYIKVKPVAELRLTSNEERQKYQATSINWSRSKGHETILVGYSDGTICYYNISSTSPILTTNENGVDIFYPYNEIKAHNGCITGVGSFPAARGVGVTCSGSPQGAALRAGAAAGAAGAAAGGANNYPADYLAMSQHWPGGYVAGDTCLFNASAPNDVEFWGNTRRLGLVHTMAECAYCGLVATYNVAQIRLMRPYPAYLDIKKRTLLSIDVKHLAKKRKIKSDELGVVVEPLTYNDAIQKYGLTIKSYNSRLNVPFQPKPQEVCIERFPLNAVTSMDFCPSYEFHNRLALGVQAGIVIITNVI